MKITFNVTAKDIKQGEHCSGYKCPVARAILRKINLKYTVNVQPENLLITNINSKKEHIFSAPEEVSSFIHNFDDSHFDSEIKVKPFKFILNLPKFMLKKNCLTSRRAVIGWVAKG